MSMILHSEAQVILTFEYVHGGSPCVVRVDVSYWKDSIYYTQDCFIFNRIFPYIDKAKEHMATMRKMTENKQEFYDALKALEVK